VVVKGFRELIREANYCAQRKRERGREGEKKKKKTIKKKQKK